MIRPAIAVLLLAGMAGGCVSSIAGNDSHIYPGLFRQNVVGNETYVTVGNVYNEIDALPLAEAHCAKYDRAAHFTRMEPARAIFDCVARGRSVR